MEMSSSILWIGPFSGLNFPGAENKCGLKLRELPSGDTVFLLPVHISRFVGGDKAVEETGDRILFLTSLRRRVSAVIVAVRKSFKGDCS